jgi:hypothetical protein
MTNLTPVSSFDDVPQYETNTQALGGSGGPMNAPLQSLLNRTQWLFDNRVVSVAGLVGTITAAALKTALALVKGDVGLGNVDNTSDANKPISTATATALAGKQATIADSGWTNATLSASWVTIGGSYSTPGYRKVGSSVYLRGTLSGGLITDGTVILTLPVGYRPTASERFSMSSSTSGAMRALIGSDGTVSIYGVTSGATIGLSGIRFFVD